MPEGTSPRVEVLRTRDLVGLDVIDAGGERVGNVADLLIDRNGTLRFLDVRLGVLKNHVLLPVETVDWHNAEALVVHRWSREQVRGLPAYDADVPLTRALLDEMALAHPRYYGGEQASRNVAAPSDARILPLKDAREFRLAKDAPNLRGWNVFGADGERVGQVTEMLVDPETTKVRYLDVDLADDLFLLKEDRHVLIPTEFVDLRERGKDVWVRQLDAKEVAQLPAYTGGPVDPTMEDRVRIVFQPEPEVPPV
ncbi:MAG TPA: PRC-barrel domain-containing protein [Longimicrobiaceae bacterium]|nr:PRC-barrel domain-containing protein [Longimicrobiaceae bacterium]